MIVRHINKSKKLVCFSFALLFVLAIFFAIAYIYIAFPLDVSEVQCEVLTNEAKKLILCRRSGGATVAFHYVLYENEIKSDNVAAVIRDAGTTPKLIASNDGCVMVHISDTNDIVYLEENALVHDLHSGGASIKFK